MLMHRARPSTVLGSLLVAAALPALAQNDVPCRPYLVPCNYADHFSGTFHWESVLGDERESVTATITNGKAVCSGSSNGPGLVAVEFGLGTDDAPTQPWYRVAVACPTTRPAEMNGTEMSTYKQPTAAREPRVLEGSSQDENPDADPANGVTGTLKLRWSLKRKGA